MQKVNPQDEFLKVSQKGDYVLADIVFFDPV